uniref:Uncharacterized protein n=1 Tax=Rhipicephalus zambeziensis TaxID=60191 RepID=A0A224YH34_9ACAR
MRLYPTPMHETMNSTVCSALMYKMAMGAVVASCPCKYSHSHTPVVGFVISSFMRHVALIVFSQLSCSACSHNHCFCSPGLCISADFQAPRELLPVLHCPNMVGSMFGPP